MAQSFARFMYCCLSTLGEPIKIFWYICKMRGQVIKILSGSCICVASAALLLLSISNVEDCVQTLYSVMCAHCYFVKCLYLHMQCGSIPQGHGPFSGKFSLVESSVLS